MSDDYQGSCQCGQVTYSMTGEPLFTYACYCRDCQKRSGGAFSMGMIVPFSALKVEGELSAYTRSSDKGSQNTRYSCAYCGNVIYGLSDDSPELAKLQPGTLDDTSAVHPDVHIWTSRMQSWLRLPDQAPKFEQQPETMMELYEAGLTYRSIRP